MAEGVPFKRLWSGFTAAEVKRRDLLEIVLAYGMIMLVVWTPRSWQRLLWWVAAASITAMVCLSFRGAEAMGLHPKGFFRSFWVVGVALLCGACTVMLAVHFHTLIVPKRTIALAWNWWPYLLWSLAQQFLLQAFFLERLLRLLKDPGLAVLIAAILLSAAHLPNPVLAPMTLLWGFAACRLFLRYRNLYVLGLVHMILGLTIGATVPLSVTHHMRVGLGYLTYPSPYRSAIVPQSSGPVGGRRLLRVSPCQRGLRG